VDLSKSTNEVKDPKLILNSLFLTKQQFDEQVEIFEGLSVETFYGILEYNEDDIDNWLVDYFMKNQDIEEKLHGISLGVTREKLSMAKGKPQQTGMTAEINSIPTYAI
jgi:hypothetical protein